MSVSDLYEYLCASKADIVDDQRADYLLKNIEQWIEKHSTANLLHDPSVRVCDTSTAGGTEVPRGRPGNIAESKEDAFIDNLFDGVCANEYKIKFGKHKDKTIPEVIKDGNT